MDYNDINNRIQRLYAAIKINNENGYAEYLRIQNIPNTNDASFKTNETEVLNKITSVISHIANFKDHLKNHLQILGKPKQLVEEEIDKSLAFQLVLDLNNSEKHGYPLRNERSNLGPRIGRVTSGLKVIGDGNSSITVDMKTGKIEKKGSVLTIIEAEIVDRNSKLVMSFDDVVSASITLIENIIKENT